MGIGRGLFLRGKRGLNRMKHERSSQVDAEQAEQAFLVRWLTKRKKERIKKAPKNQTSFELVACIQ